MPDDLDLMQLASTGQKLARVDDTDYLACHLVLAWPAGGVPSLYCSYGDWAATPIARLAAKEQEIAELAQTLESWAAEVMEQTRRATAAEARVKELEAQLATVPPPPQTPAQNQAAQFEAQAAYLNDAPPDPPPEPIICPDCDKGGWASQRALQMHRQRVHQGMLAFGNKPKQFVEELGWRCAAKGCAGAHARDLHDPHFCTLHAQRQLSNGVEATA